MRNIWSSNPTSRSLESVLFAQIPYDSAVKTAITGGRNGTELSGMPQLFAQKGYETWFTTGSSIDLDDWDKFLPTHGFDTIWDNNKMMQIAESDLGIKPDDWLGEPHRGLNWGVHDDVSFQILGDLLVNKTKEQRERAANGESKPPAFISHCTISSHAPFDLWPTWYAESDKPDLSVFYEGHAHADLIERYLTVRSFTDLELGKFMDRMLEQGVLNDTIVVITGDHGQAPEADVTNTHEESMTRVAAAIIAEGRLGGAVGMVIEDAVEQYDLLNTLADITGVPDGGFVQTGVGRSLKRKVPYGERVVFSNEPARKMSIVRGHQRLRYDQVSDSMMLHDTSTCSPTSQPKSRLSGKPGATTAGESPRTTPNAGTRTACSPSTAPQRSNTHNSNTSNIHYHYEPMLLYPSHFNIASKSKLLLKTHNKYPPITSLHSNSSS
ncbi:hypothetical protein PF007_g21732 [Phytophthora fragariae]|uniref:Sulfatase N-terminal domain-containing protein n=1 Tax=Phytophthora fragariae TaxID=53985 RepID=A0A6A3QYD5_9STRA|nr:hypothetical protein PF007_g21732 [Phytophthora fragariae]KAE9288059.1 hypothetical protein PF001_g20692 [Phytophthora fragariae]